MGDWATCPLKLARVHQFGSVYLPISRGQWYRLVVNTDFQRVLLYLVASLFQFIIIYLCRFCCDLCLISWRTPCLWWRHCNWEQNAAILHVWLTGPHCEACQRGDDRQWSDTWQVLVVVGLLCASHLSDGYTSPVPLLHTTSRLSKLPTWQGWWWHWQTTRNRFVITTINNQSNFYCR